MMRLMSETRGAFTLLLLLVSLLTTAQVVAKESVFRVVNSVDAVVDSVESARHVSAVILISSASDDKLQALLRQNGGDNDGDAEAMVRALEAQFPHVGKIAQGLEGAVEFVVADIPDAKAITKKWNIATLPALVVYKDAPKVNPYTGKLYRDATLTPMTVLQQPRELKKLLKESIPGTYVEDWANHKTLSEAEKNWAKDTDSDALVVLLSKQNSASYLFKALSVEFESRGVAFAYANHETPVGKEMLEQWGVNKLPALVVIKSSETFDDREVVHDESKMKTLGDLKSLVEPMARSNAQHGDNANVEKGEAVSKSNTMPLLTAANFESNVLKSGLVWIVSFLDEESEKSVDRKKWRKIMNDMQKKSGLVVVGAVSCTKDTDLCEKYGGTGTVRVFPVKYNEETSNLDRDEVLPELYKSVDEAKQPAIDSIPNIVSVMGSSAELNAFVSRALEAKAMPVLLITSKMDIPPILKSLALSFPSQNVALGVVSDADPQIKYQFRVPPKAKSTFLALVPVEKKEVEDHPGNAAPFGIFMFDKKTMGSLTYPNLVRFLASVLAQHPHPRSDSKRDDGSPSFTSDHAVAPNDSGEVDVPYLRRDNLDSLCGGNKICAIGFFEGHIDTLADEDSALAKSVSVIRDVATKSKQSRQPFRFMWTNGKCQNAFAESFGVGAFQMPTIVVYSPSKGRYATNIGVFDEENTFGFLQGVLTGKISTIPVQQIGELREECSIEEVEDNSAMAEKEVEDDEDLGDLLSEIIGDEEKQRRELEAELAKERKKTKDKSKKSKGKNKKKKGKKGKKKGGDDHDEL